MDFIKDHLLLVEYLILGSVAMAYWMLDTKTKIFDKCLNVLMLSLVAGIPIIYSSITRSVFEVNKLLLLRLVLFFGYGLWITKNILLQSQLKKIAESRYYRPGIIPSLLVLSIVALIVILPMAVFWKVFALLVMGLALYILPSLSFQWTFTKMESAFLLWLLVNTVATVFSQNIYVSIIGSYDRWEGILTVYNYVMLALMFSQLVKTTRTLYWILGGLLVSTTFSAIYGIFQSFGIDFMHWSVDPTSRVFASINNPVHFSAYVGMLVPVGLGFLLHLWSLSKDSPVQDTKYDALKWVIYISTFLCYYALYLSYSRAATLGFCAAMTILYLFSLELFSLKSRKNFIIDFFFTGGFIAFFYIDYIFNYFQHASLGKYVILATGSFFVIYFIYQMYALYSSSDKQTYIKDFIANIILLTMFFFDDRFTYLKEGWGYLVIAAMVAVVIAYLIHTMKTRGFDGVKLSVKLLVIYAFAKLQFVTQSWSAIGIYFMLLPLLYVLVQPKENVNKEFIKNAVKFFSIIIVIPIAISLFFERTMINSLISPDFGILIINFIFLFAVSFYLFILKKEAKTQEKNVMLLSFMLLFAVIVFVPSFSDKMTDLFSTKQGAQFGAASNAAIKVGSYSTIAIQGSARTSMWKSSVKWAKDYWWLGTGPDTVKEMYPKYRRDDYGILEGGHNLTPDRVHNEYINTLITTGVISFVIRWFLVVGGFLFVSLLFLYKNVNRPLSYILIGTFAGAIVHLGQLNFNFSVVATAVLFYVLIGLSLAIGYHGLGNPAEPIESIVDSPDSNNLKQGKRGKSKKELRLDSPLFDEPFDIETVDSGTWSKVGIVWIVVGVLVWQAFWPYMAERYYRDGFNSSSQKNFDVSTMLLAKACEYAPWETQYRVQLGKDYEDMAGTKTDTAEKIKALQKAEKEYDEIIRISPLNPWYLNRLANIDLQYQNLYTDPKMKLEYLNKAGQLLKDAAEIDNNNPLFHMSYGYYLHKLGKFDEAMLQYNHVLAIDGRMSEARFNIADIYRTRGEITRSVQEYEYIASNDATFGNVYDSLGRIYFSQKEYTKAAFAFEKALITNPSDLNVLRNLGATYHQLGNWDKAISAYRNALRLSPGAVDIRRYLAHAYYNKGEIALAIVNLEEVAKAMPGDASIQQNLTAMRYQLQRK